MADQKNVKADVTGYINTEEIRDVLKENAEKKQKKECFIKRIFKKKNKEN